MIQEIIQNYDVNKLNVQLKDTYTESLKSSKILEQFANNCKLICMREFKNNKNKITFVQENEIEKNFF